MQRLIKRAKEGDSQAFIALMENERQSMYKMAWSYLKNEEDIADAIQDTILACYENIGQLKSPKYFKTWLLRILINKCNDIIRKKPITIDFTEIPERGAIDTGFYEYEWQEVLSQLDEKYRTVILMYYFEGLNVREISSLLDTNQNTILTWLSRAKKQLKLICEEDAL